jgi:hypothetical protein
MNSQRVVALSGVSQIDPSQTDMPRQWRSLPSFILTKNDTLKLEEKGRGDMTPTPNRFTLSRTVHLDFDGDGFTVEDNISGVVADAMEMSMLSPFKLGKATLNGRPHLVVETSGGAGVGLPKGNLSLVTVSRVESGRVFNAVGWSESSENLSLKMILT